MNRSPTWTLVATVGLAVLLAVLAVLQYRWVAQFTTADRERQKTLLASRAEQVALDVDREVTRAYIWLQSDVPFALGEGADDRLAEGAKRWFESAPYPQLLSEVYRLAIDEGRQGALERYDRAAGRFVPAEWTPELSAWRERAVRSTGPGPGTPVDPPPLGATVEADLGAIVMPRRLLHRVAGGSYSVSRELRYTIATLNIGFLEHDLLPSLWTKYFPASEQVHYAMAVARVADGRTIVASEGADPAETRQHADITTPLLRLRPNEFGRFMVEAQHRQAHIGGPTGGPGTQPEGPPPPPGQAPSRITLSVVTREGAPPGERPFAMRRTNDPAWTLFIRHRAGSLEAAAQRTRRWNLGMSFGMLVLLAASLGLVVASARRSERLARQQMEFVAGVSHELRTPLAVIRSAAENLADGVVADASQVKRYGAVIAGEGRRLTDMVEQVMEYARFDTGRRRPVAEPVQPAAVVQGAIERLGPWLRDHGVGVECHLDPSLPIVEGDAAALARAVQNLVSNAAKYGDGRWVGVRAWTAAGLAGRDVHIAVSDRGEAIPESEVARIFEPFERGRRAIEAQIPGAGLGLSLVRRTAEEHGGRVTVGRANGTTTFTLTLPASSRAEGEPVPAALRPYSPGA